MRIDIGRLSAEKSSPGLVFDQREVAHSRTAASRLDDRRSINDTGRGFEIIDTVRVIGTFINTTIVVLFCWRTARLTVCPGIHTFVVLTTIYMTGRIWIDLGTNTIILSS